MIKIRTSPATAEDIKQAYSSALFINQGSVWDIKIHIRSAGSRYSLKQLCEELDRETITRNRSTVKKMINTLIRKMERIVKNA